ncbi:MAG: InlB B-repeat-containing protein [Lachnospiraceae bacterium]|nr:InlB B-repeat-containing protein [Lachnospiraceae bacterium]
MIFLGSNRLKNFYIGSSKVKKMYLGSELVYSAGGVVTYYVDVGITYTEEVESDATCLSPTTFTPTKSGYTFVGWRKDNTASSDVLDEKTMADESVSLYAVFEKAITLTYYNGSASASAESGTIYYNNGNAVNPTFTLTPATVSGFTFSGWCTSSSATASVAYTSISDTEFASDATLYAKYYQTITLTYYSTSSTAATETGTRYYNSGNYTNPTFTISSPSLSGWSFLGWIVGSTSATGTVSYTSINSTAFSADTTLYAKFSQTITLTYYSTSSTAATKTGTRYFNAYGNYSNPTFTISSPSVSGWSFLGWISGSTSATGTVSYTSISSTVFSANATLYAKFSQTITLSYNGNSATSGSTSPQTGTRYWNAYGNYSNPTFTLASNGYTRTGYSFSKWAQNSTSGAQYAAGASVTLSADATFYAIWTADVIKVYIQFVDTGDATKNYCKLTLTDMSTNSAIYTAYHYESSGTYWYSQISYAGVVAFNFTDSDDYPAAYYNPFFCATALTTLYSNTGLSTVGLAKGSYIEYNQHNDSGVTSATYYVSMVNVSI